MGCRGPGGFIDRVDQDLGMVRVADYKAELEAGLEVVMSELFDPQVGFTQIEDRDICKYCPYSKLCHRG